MKFGGLGMPELLIILAVALLIFGPKNLPKLGNTLGRTVKSLREGMGEGAKKASASTSEEDVVEVEEEEEPQPVRKKKPASAHKADSQIHESDE